MTPRAVLAAQEILARWLAEERRAPLDRLVNGEVRERRYLNSRERRWLTDAIYRVARFRRRWLAMCETLHLDPSPQVLTRLAGGEAAAPFLEGVISPEALEVAEAALPAPDSPKEYLRITLSYPDSLAEALESLLGEEAVAAGEALNGQAPVTLRTNLLRATRDALLKALPEATPTRYSPWGIELTRREPVTALPGFRSGAFEVQEEASQLAVLLSEAKAGDIVAEVGAGGGGKTLALAAMMRNRGRIFALDISERRLEETEKRVHRVGVKNVTPVLLETNEAGDWVSLEWGEGGSRQGFADCVFLDAPCTGTGTLRRSPDAKWRAHGSAGYVRLQALLLRRSAGLTRPGGRLCYVTCAIEREQNEGVVEAFLASEAGRDFELEALPAEFSEFDSQGYFRSWPHRQGLDAFFMARLRRKEALSEDWEDSEE